jgi:hypothetical protein
LKRPLSLISQTRVDTSCQSLNVPLPPPCRMLLVATSFAAVYQLVGAGRDQAGGSSVSGYEGAHAHQVVSFERQLPNGGTGFRERYGEWRARRLNAAKYVAPLQLACLSYEFMALAGFCGPPEHTNYLGTIENDL